MKLIGYTIASLLIAVLASAIVWAVWHNVWMAAVSYIVSGNATMFVLVYSSFRAQVAKDAAQDAKERGRAHA
ncbi:hypothetical protein [Celeribacter sp.]|uniref:hypothetical protein n=1 Tax=Celeribacter sp. TaxID=1890673 RepID=UPI003A9496B0